jgi:hypothetical protein
MDAQAVLSNSQGGLTVKAYRADGAFLMAFDLDPGLTNGLAGFAIKCTPPSGTPYFIPNRIGFTSVYTSQTTPSQRIWMPSNQAPIQKFRWVDFPPEITDGTYTFDVSAMYFDPATGLKSGPTTQVSFDFLRLQNGPLEVGFTRGYLSSQAYAVKFKNAPFSPDPRTMDYDTTLYTAQYNWLGFHARKMVFDFIQECLADPTTSVDLFAYDLDEPDFIRFLQQLGSRLRAVLDDAPLHTRTGALENNTRQVLIASAGQENIKTGHFKRFAHSKVLIQKRNGLPVKVLSGSTNFSIRGLYVQANNNLVFNDPATASLYEQAFEEAFTNMPGFARSPIAQQWHDVSSPPISPFSVCFSTHTSATISLGRVSAAIQNAKSSVIYAIMELQGGGPVMNELVNLGSNPGIFAYGITQSVGGLNLYKPGETHAIFADFSFLRGKVPAPFQQEWNGGPGQVIHHKFVVVDFNQPGAILFTGSSNLAEGGETHNGDNLIAITDPTIVQAYAVEAIRLVDHYHFRMVMQKATADQPLRLQPAGASAPWWQPYYDSSNVKFNERLLFVQGAPVGNP